MAKMTLANLGAFVKDYVNVELQAKTWQSTSRGFMGLVDKVGRIVTIDGSFENRLTDLDGEFLSAGKTIEEYFIDLTLPQSYAYTSAKKKDFVTQMGKHESVYLPTVEDVAYSYTLGENLIPTTIPNNDIQQAALSAEGASSMVSTIYKRLNDSYIVYKNALKEQLVGNAVKKVLATTANKANLTSIIAKPTDAITGEAFIEEVQKVAERSEKENEGNNLGNYLTAKAEGLKLYIKDGIMPSLKVQTRAGAFQLDELALPAEIEKVIGFGDADSKVFAVLMDKRMCKLCPSYEVVDADVFNSAGITNFYHHSEHTAFISKSTFVHVFMTE